MGDVNFMPVARLVRKRRRARCLLWVVVCLAYSLLLAAGAFAAHMVGTDDGGTISQQLETVNRQVDGDDRALQDLRRSLAQAAATLTTTQAMQEQPNWGRLLVALSQELGEQLVLTHCQLATLIADKALTDRISPSLLAKPLGAFLAEHHYRLTLTGSGKTQESVSRFVLRLEQTEVFDRVRLVSSCRQTFLGGEAVSFSVECHF